MNHWWVWLAVYLGFTYCVLDHFDLGWADLISGWGLVKILAVAGVSGLYISAIIICICLGQGISLV